MSDSIQHRATQSSPLRRRNQNHRHPLQVAQLQSGQAITVHIDPNNPQNIVLPTGHNP
jgi:hypothetical protein